MNLFKNLFKKQPKKQTVTLKSSKLDFIGKTKTIDILSEQEIDNKIQSSLGNNIAKTNQNNTFSGTQTFEFAKVSRVLGTDPKDIINWSVFDTRATSIENRVTTTTQEVERLERIVQQQANLLASHIMDTKDRFDKLKIPRTIFSTESSLTSVSGGDIESYSVGNGVWNFKITNSKTVTFSGSAIYSALASKYEADRNTTIKVRVSNVVSAFMVDNANFRLPVGTVEITVNGTYPFELKKNTSTISVTIKNARGIATGDPKTVLRNIMCYCSFFRVLS